MEDGICFSILMFKCLYHLHPTVYWGLSESRMEDTCSSVKTALLSLHHLEHCLHPLFTLQLVAHKLSPSTMMHPTNRQSTVRGTMGGIDNTLHPTVVQLVECFIIVHVTSQGFYFTSGENCNEEPWNTISAVFVELCICYLCHWLY